jgi:hypothetical protein
MLIAMIALAATEQDAALLVRAAVARSTPDTVPVGQTAGRRCIIMIARATVVDTDSFEDEHTMSRFLPAIRAALST